MGYEKWFRSIQLSLDKRKVKKAIETIKKTSSAKLYDLSAVRAK